MIFEFADSILNTDRHVLIRGGQEVAIEPQVFDILRLFAENAGVLVSKDQLIEEVWGGRIVSEATISARINAARTAVGDSGAKQAVIRTVPRRGFEMVAPVVVAQSDEPPDEPSAKPIARQTIRFTRAAEGPSIAWSSAGEGPPLMLAWHHLSHLENDWSTPLLHDYLHGLSEGRRVVRFDIRGSGLSDPIGAKNGVDAQVDDLMAVADAAALDAFPIAAVMQAAAVAIRAAVRYPDRISRLALHNPYARGRAVREGKLDSPEHDPFVALLNSGGWGNAESAFMRAWGTIAVPSASPEEITDLIRLISDAGTAEDAILQRLWLDQLDVADVLVDVRCPTLATHARLCAIHPVQEGRRVASGIPGAEFAEFDSANAIPISSDPATKQLVAAMREFLDAGD